MGKKDMDEFLERLRIFPNGQELSLTILLQAWSLYDRRWWLGSGSTTIEWIDGDAEEHSASVTDELLLPLVSPVPLVSPAHLPVSSEKTV